MLSQKGGRFIVWLTERTIQTNPVDMTSSVKLVFTGIMKVKDLVYLVGVRLYYDSDFIYKKATLQA